MNRNMKAITWAMEVRGLEPGPWRVLMVLCGHVGKRDYCVWPSLKTIAEKAEISRPSAKRYVSLLQENGLIEHVEIMWRENGGRSSNKYRIRVDEIAVEDHDDEEEDDFVSVRDPRVNLNRGQTHSYDPGARVTGEPSREPLIEGTSQLEDSPLPTEEPPLEGELDLLGDLVPANEGPTGLIDYVKTQWAELSSDYPRIANPRVWSEGRRKKIRARAFEVVRESGHEVTAVQVWDQIFAAIRGSEWLRGEAAPGKGYSESFVIDLDRLLQQNMFFKILERAPVDAERNRTIPTVNGRQLGPADQAAYHAIQRQLARRKLKRGGGDQGGGPEDQPRDR